MQNSPQSESWGGLTWSNWLPLDAGIREYQRVIRRDAGFYRVRIPGLEELVYVGQTGRNLRERVRALARGVYRGDDDPPWNDPHTAAPLLWAYRREDGLSFEVSVAYQIVNKPVRECWEDMLLYAHRCEFGRSTLCNHGLEHQRWTRPSNKKAGRPSTRRSIAVDFPSLAPPTGSANCTSIAWLGLSWSDPVMLRAAAPPAVAGVYRLLSTDGMVTYVGESMSLKSRLSTHRRKPAFADSLVSWSEMVNAPKHQLHEREADLVGAFYKKYGHPPLHQY
ncbi:MAG: hypothetical protein ACI8QZ_003044 [Chlamydiales bacterium]|jgi:hypothetical protein